MDMLKVMRALPADYGRLEPAPSLADPWVAPSVTDSQTALHLPDAQAACSGQLDPFGTRAAHRLMSESQYSCLPSPWRAGRASPIFVDALTSLS